MTDACRDARQLADAFVSGQLLVETAESIVGHLAGCMACRAEFEARRRLRDGLKEAFERSHALAPRPAFTAALEARLAAEAAAPVDGRRPWRQWGSLAAGMVVAVLLGLVVLRWLTPGTLDALAHLAAGDHQFCALTYKLEEEPISLEEAARSDPALLALTTVEPAALDLAGHPLAIIERHACAFGGRRFAHLVVSYKGQAVSILVAADAADDRGPSTVRGLPSAAGFQMATFHGTSHVVFVVSSLPAGDVQAVARLVEAPVTRALAGV